MKVRHLEIENFRGVKSGAVTFQQHTLLVGGNNIGKSTVCEALELVLGPERLYRRPVIDEHDFSSGAYLDDDGNPQTIQIRVILTDLSDEQQRRFGSHLRLWDDQELAFIDNEPNGLARADDDLVAWSLPVIFIGRYDRDEDDFVGDTFFDHPLPENDELDDDAKAELGLGRALFTRAHKRLCGFIFLRALRTGSRALSLQRGSLLDTVLRLSGDGSTEMWAQTLSSLEGLDPAIGEIDQLKLIRDSIRERLGKFVSLAAGDHSTTFFASDLTREHLREVVRLFIATQPSEHAVPFARQGTGSVNLLVFALLTLIADLKEGQSAIFVMEEPEIALPPHLQRRVTKYVVQQMGQSIVTSHSPYVIEQFDAKDVVILSREGSVLTGSPIDDAAVKAKTYRTNRRQFAEAILSRAVLVVEGATEASIFPAASAVLEQVRVGYEHVDLSGVSIFNAGSDGSVPKFAPIFKALGKRVYGTWDQPNSPAAATAEEDKKSFERWWESPEKGIEGILVKQTTTDVQRRFLDEVVQRDDYPAEVPYSVSTPDEDLADVAIKVLVHRKGEFYGYAAALIQQCQTEDELPAFVRDVLIAIDEDLAASPELALEIEEPVPAGVDSDGDEEA
jgi:putative ATP-dependent endonuclease of OLD family